MIGAKKRVFFEGIWSAREHVMTGNGADVRWKQRFANFKKALSQLKKFVEKGQLNELEEQGVIQAFEYTYELA